MINTIDRCIATAENWLSYECKYDWPYKLTQWMFHAYFNIRHGAASIVKWTPLIWKDRDWDYAYLARLIAFKLNSMAKESKDISSRNHRDMLVCSELFKRMGDGGYIRDRARANFFQTADYHHDSLKEYPKMVAKIMGRRMYYWWS